MVLLAVCGWLLVSKINRFELMGQELKETRAALTKEIQVLRVFMAETQGNRFTDDEGLQVWKAIAELQTKMAEVPTEAPPKWFKDNFDQLQSVVGDMQKTMESTDANVVRLQADVEILKRNCAPANNGG
jgi:hypothetical protein